MMTLYVILMSLFAAVMASDYCDNQLKEIQVARHNFRQNCTLESATIKTCCDVRAFYFCDAPSGVHAMKCWCGGKWNIADVYCDSQTADGGWIVIQRRKDGSVNFDRPWADYVKGFGDLNGEFWYGLKAINCLTTSGRWGSWELRIDFEFQNRTKSYMHYRSMVVGHYKSMYPLRVQHFLGITPTDPFKTGGQQQKFTTYDKDNDRYSGCCATQYGKLRGNGGWWYNKCWHINPNLKFGPSQFGFLYLAGRWYNPRWIEMKIRPYNCQPL